MSKIKTALTYYKGNKKKIAAGIATASAVQKTAKKYADKWAAQWSLDGDIDYDLWAAANETVRQYTVENPLVPSRKFRHKELTQDDADFSGGVMRLNDWVVIRVPGCPLIQVKTIGYETVFRAVRKKDFEPLMAFIEGKITKKVETPTRISFDDYPSTTALIAWDSKNQQWEHRKERTSRSFGSVFIPAELQAEIEHDLKTFTESRKRLNRLELSWRRGYLLSGPPGTGKTSMSLAIAGSLGFQLASLSLTGIKSDEELKKAVSQLRNRTVLVIEDIDAYSISNDREHNAAKDGDLSLSGLLNALDGFETPDGLVTIATTNHIEHLDAALIRSGRMDRVFTLDHIAGPELERLFTWFYEEQPPTSAPAYTKDALIAPAEVTELFKQQLNDPKAGWEAAMDRIDNAVSAESLTAA
jgi:hypothetical protein